MSDAECGLRAPSSIATERFATASPQPCSVSGYPDRQSLRTWIGPRSATVSVVIPVFDEEAAICRTVVRVLELRVPGMEVVLVDDGSTDRTWEFIRELASENDCVIGIRLSRNFGQQAALVCGYVASVGDAVVCLDADLQDPPELIPRMIDAWRNGSDVVLAVRTGRDGEGFFKRVSAWLYYRLLRSLSERVIPLDVGDFRLLSRSALEAMLSIEGSDALLRGTVGWIGFPTATIRYQRAQRVAGQTKYRLRDMLRLARNGIFATERGPVVVGHVFASGGLFLAVVLGWLGWTVLAALCVVVPALLYLAIISEYSALIQRKLLRRPTYILQEVVRKPHDP